MGIDGAIKAPLNSPTMVAWMADAHFDGADLEAMMNVREGKSGVANAEGSGSVQPRQSPAPSTCLANCLLWCDVAAAPNALETQTNRPVDSVKTV